VGAKIIEDATTAQERRDLLYAGCIFTIRCSIYLVD